MARALLIAEKPDLMKKVKNVYTGYGHKDTIDFVAFAGHTMTLLEPEEYTSAWSKWDMAVLPMIPEKFRYKPDDSKVEIYNKTLSKIKNGNYDYLINCCDPGREGQAIFFAFYDTIGCTLPVKRMWHHDLSDGELKKALDNLRDEKEPALVNMTKASKLRAYFDWLIGMNFTRTFGLKSNSRASLGRVMTPILAIVVNRELEIRNFKPKDFWEIEADFGKYKGTYFNDDGKTQILKKKDAEDIIKSLLKNGEIISVDSKKETKYAPELHSLENLQNEANRVFGYTMLKTLSIAQSLYERQLLSYPRTDSACLTSNIAKEFNKILAPLTAISELNQEVNGILKNPTLLKQVASNKKYVDDKKVSDHYAITPTENIPDFSKLTQEEINIYTLVAKRFVSIFLPPFVTNKSTIITEDNKHKFKTVGSVLVDLGYMRLYNSNFQNAVIPSVKKGEQVILKGTKLITKQTIAPQRYTDETLNKALANAGKFVEEDELKEVLKEAKGIGTPATRGQIIDKLVTKNMMTRTGKGKIKVFSATDYGVSIILSLKGHDITSPKLTGEWEQKLRLIEACTYNPNVFYKEMIEYIKHSTEVIKKMSTNVINTGDKEVLGKCPKCGKPVVEGQKGFGCSAYNKDGTGCDFVVWKEFLGATISKIELKKLLAGKETKEFKLKKKDGTEFKSKLILGINGKISFPKAKSIGVCPKCGKSINKTAKGYGCSGYKDGCDFVIWEEAFGTKFSAEEVQKLLNKKETSELTCNKKSGGTYTSKFILGDDYKVTFAPRSIF